MAVNEEKQPGLAGESAKRTYLVTGGAGFLGINMTRYLLERGHRVVSLDMAPFDYPEQNRITEVRGDIRDRAAVERAMQGVDIVIHTAAALPLYKPEDIYSTDIEGLRTVLDVAHVSDVERVVHISSTAVYGIPDHHPLFETDRLHGVGPYGEAKVVAEQLCQEYRAKGMCVPIIRPKSFVGPERLGVFALFYDWAKTFPFWGVARIVISCWTWKTSAPPSIWRPRAIARSSTMSLTLGRRNLPRCVRTIRLC